MRPPGPEDLHAVAALLTTAGQARNASRVLRTEDLRIRWLMLEDPRDAVVLELPGSPPTIIAYASAPIDVDPATGDVLVHLEGEIHPAWTSRRLATFLLDRAEAAGRGYAASIGTTAAVPTVRIRTPLVDGGLSARAWFDARGFVTVRHLLELRLDLHAPPPAPRWPDGVTVRTYRPGRDDDVLWRTHQAAFADVATHLPIAREDYLDDRIRHDERFDPGLVLLAEHTDAADRTPPVVVGVAVCRSGTEVAAEDGLVRDLGVVPGWRRRGIAMALLRAAFAAFRARGLTGVALEVDDVTLDGAVALYRRAGMRITHRTDVLERVSAAASRPPG
ncbi:MAG: GNAT family N-acetyltransferase [Nitriliruptoraceae bacterium]